ncbi:MAG: acyl-CoA desaturase [Bacteroidia bacterium]|nr:acyl-CoA desaturase [Bacteroidia bacterium]MCF8447992.1 acyl-CoA desaturase [Bacteroidia bacterium]
MKLIKFHSDISAQKDFAKELRHNVNLYFKDNNISTKGNFVMILKTISVYSLYVLPLAAIFYYNLSFSSAFWMYLIAGFGTAGVGMSVMHDALHNSYSKHKWVNKMMGYSMYLIGSNVFNWKIQHNIFHHAYTNIDGLDEDIQPRWIMRFSEQSQLKPIHKYQYLYSLPLYTMMTFSMLVVDLPRLMGYEKVGLMKQHLGDPKKEYSILIGVKLIYLFILIGLPIIYTDLAWWQVLVSFTGMHMVAGFIFAIVFQMAHIVEGVVQPVPNENKVTENEWAVHQLMTTANFAPKNWLLNWYVGGLNFQVEHHLFPNICHLHYPKISKIVEATAKKYGFPYLSNPTLIGAVKSHLKRLKELGVA